MDLYIRSKDRMQIEKMRRIQYEPLSEFNFHTGTSEDKDNGTILVNGRNFGEYTQEQALKILNDIQYILTPICCIKTPEPIPIKAESKDELFQQLMQQSVIMEQCKDREMVQQVETIIYELPIPEDTVLTETEEKCCFCGKAIPDRIQQNDPRPIVSKNGKYCCNECNENIVCPTREKVW